MPGTHPVRNSLLVVLLALGGATTCAATDQHFAVHYEPSTAPGELTVKATYFLWVPDEVKTLRGIIVHQHGCGAGAEQGGVTASHDLHWQALARKWDCALLGSSYRAKGASCRLWCDPRKGSSQRFLQAIADLAKQSGHPELERVPWCLWGHSGGGFWSSLMQAQFPERIVAIWLRSGTAFGYWEKGEIDKPELTDAVFQVPVMCNPGAREKDDPRFHVAWDGGLAMFHSYRSQGAPMGFAPDPNTAHECGDSRYLAIPFFDACLEMRLPGRNDEQPTLRPIDFRKAWVAAIPTPGEPSPSHSIAEFSGKKVSEPVWLPNATFAKAWSEYMEKGAVSDRTPPPAPTTVTAKRLENGSLQLAWTAQADFESGLGGFIILRDGQEVARLPEKPVSRFGRPLFQGMSYHDTPTEPLRRMEWVQNGANADEALDGAYTVIAVNSAGLKSAPSQPAKAPATVADSNGASIVIGGLLESEGGDWDPKTSPLTRPFGVDFDRDGNMFIVELEGGRVHQLDSQHKLTRIAGDGSKSYKGDGGPIADATFNGMHNCAVTPNGDVYIADTWNHCIRRIERQRGTISTIAGTGQAGFTGDGGAATKATFDFIMCISLDHANEHMYVADLRNRRIRVVSLADGTVRTVAGNGERGVPKDGAPAVDSPLVDPRAVCADSQGNVYILERGGHALRVVRPDGTIHTVAGSGKSGHKDGNAIESQFGSPKHICVDDQDNVYIADDQNKAIRRYDPQTKTITTVLGRGFGDSRIQLLNPHGVCWEKGHLIVVDTSHNRILKITPSR